MIAQMRKFTKNIFIIEKNKNKTIFYFTKNYYIIMLIPYSSSKFFLIINFNMIISSIRKIFLFLKQ